MERMCLGRARFVKKEFVDKMIVTQIYKVESDGKTILLRGIDGNYLSISDFEDFPLNMRKDFVVSVGYELASTSTEVLDLDEFIEKKKKSYSKVKDARTNIFS